MSYGKYSSFCSRKYWRYWAYRLSNRERSLRAGNIAIMVAINDPRRKSIVVVLVLREAKECCPALPKRLCKRYFFGIATLDHLPLMLGLGSCLIPTLLVEKTVEFVRGRRESQENKTGGGNHARGRNSIDIEGESAGGRGMGKKQTNRKGNCTKLPE